MAGSPVLLILGAGPNIGAHVANKFAENGYQIALAARRLADGVQSDGHLHVQADLSKPETVPAVFEKVKQTFGLPSVVIYNAVHFTPDPANDPFSSFSLPDFQTSLAVNTTSVLISAQQAVLAFRQLPASASKTFIFTGNILNLKTVPGMMTFGMGKTATAHAIEYAATAYKGEGFKFYYADERTSTGTHVGSGIDGPAAAEAYLELARQKDQGPWEYTFVKGQGYKSF